MRSLWSRCRRVVFALALACTAAAVASAASLDEAQRAGRTDASFPQASEDYFHDMDGGVALTPEEVKGRNMWLVWTGGNDRFWDRVIKNSFGHFDLLKIVTSHPSQTYCDGNRCDRDSRWHWLGAINEPCFDKPTGPDPKRFGLWLDVRDRELPARSVRERGEYPGVKIGARGQPSKTATLPVGSYFGYATGDPRPAPVPQSRFRRRPRRTSGTPSATTPTRPITTTRKLVRPYRVGMSCGFCHVGPSPIHPPADPAHPAWANLSSTVGAQYIWVDRLFIYDGRRAKTSCTSSCTPIAAGAMDTSLVSTDNINNPRTMNAIYISARASREPALGQGDPASGGNSTTSSSTITSTPPGHVLVRRTC